MIHTSLTLHCQNCHADITFEDMTPEWKIDEGVRERVRVAREYSLETSSGSAVADRLLGKLPDFVTLIPSGLELTKIHVVEAESRYIECPICGEHTFLGEVTETCWLHSDICKEIEE